MAPPSLGPQRRHEQALTGPRTPRLRSRPSPRAPPTHRPGAPRYREKRVLHTGRLSVFTAPGLWWTQELHWFSELGALGAPLSGAGLKSSGVPGVGSHPSVLREKLQGSSSLPSVGGGAPGCRRWPGGVQPLLPASGGAFSRGGMLWGRSASCPPCSSTFGMFHGGTELRRL